MKKSTKVIATVIAVTLVITAMLVAIYAATAGNANISANVSWTAQAGVNLEFWAKATGGDQEKSVAKSTIAPTTTNASAKIQGDLSCNFKDDSNDGVNNPGAITFKYYVKNNSLTPLNIRVTKTPEAGAESGTSANDHKPKIVLASAIGSNNVLANALGTSGCELTAGETFEYSVVLSMASGGTGIIDANTGLMKDFDAGVNFLFNVGNETNGNIVTQIDSSSPVTVASSTVSGQTLCEYLSTIEPEYCSGWFFDEGLTKAVTEQNLNASLRDSASASLYTKTASTTGLTFALNSDGNSYAVSSNGATGELIIPNKYNGKYVTRIGKGAFYNNQNITSVVLPNSILGISVDSVSSTINASNIVNTSVTKNIAAETGPPEGASNGAFESCTKLTKITIPNSVISIDYQAFYSCSGLTSITIPDSVTSIGFSAFQECSGLTSITIPDSVTSIGNYAFQYCIGLTSITIPDSVTSIGNLAFSNCSGLTSIKVASGNTKYDSRDNCNAIIETASNTLIQGCKTTVISNTVTKVGYCAFLGCSGLTNITIPNSVTSIGYYAFASCTKLTKIYIPSSVTTISASSYSNSPFCDCSSTLKIYCEAGSKPSGWGTYWNYYDESKTLTTLWSQTLADFNAA